MIQDGNWQSLSIPKGGSKSFNETKFSKEKGKQHFTDEFLDDKKLTCIGWEPELK